PLDLLHVGLDAGGGAAGLLVLQGDEGGLVLVVGGIELEGAAGHERGGDQHHQRHRVLPGEPAPPHSSTWLARSRSSGVTGTPSCRAVFRFRMSSKVEERSIGRSEGRGPLKIFAT